MTGSKRTVARPRGWALVEKAAEEWRLHARNWVFCTARLASRKWKVLSAVNGRGWTKLGRGSWRKTGTSRNGGCTPLSGPGDRRRTWLRVGLRPWLCARSQIHRRNVRLRRHANVGNSLSCDFRRRTDSWLCHRDCPVAFARSAPCTGCGRSAGGYGGQQCCLLHLLCARLESGLFCLLPTAGRAGRIWVRVGGRLDERAQATLLAHSGARECGRTADAAYRRLCLAAGDLPGLCPLRLNLYGGCILSDSRRAAGSFGHLIGKEQLCGAIRGSVHSG